MNLLVLWAAAAAWAGDSFGGVEVGTPFVASGFRESTPGVYVRTANVAGYDGALSVMTCGAIVQQVGFNRVFADRADPVGPDSRPYTLVYETEALAADAATTYLKDLALQLAGLGWMRAPDSAVADARIGALTLHKDGASRVLAIVQTDGRFVVSVTTEALDCG